MTKDCVAPPALYRFGEFDIDPASRELRRSGQDVPLPVKVFACIIYLIENRHRAVARDELMVSVWGHAHLTESVLGQVIRQARQLLSDDGEQQKIIKTVRGYGYRWILPMEEEPSSSTPLPAAARRRPRLRVAVVGALALLLAAVAGLLLHARRDTASEPVAEAPSGSDSIALMLPVSGVFDPDDAWVRLGLMDFVANRLRAAGQPMVPTDSVVALLRGLDGTPDVKAIGVLTSSTRARVVLDAHAEKEGDDWRVSLRDIADSRATLAAVGKGKDVLAAARDAADRIAIGLGRTPAREPGAKPDLALLVQRTNAAMLAQKPDVARRIIDEAPAALRDAAEIRLQRGRIAFSKHDLSGADAIFAALSEDVAAQREPVMRARILNGLAAVRALRGDRTRAESMLEEAARILGDRDAPDTLDVLGTVWMNLGNVAQERGDLDLARERMARARRIFEGGGDVRNLAVLDGNVGVLETRRERYADALRLFERAAELDAAIQDAGGELTALSFAVEVRLLLLDVRGAAAAESRLKALIARTTNPELVARGQLTLVDLYDAGGRIHASDALLEQAQGTASGGTDLRGVRFDADVKQAEHALRRGDAVQAAQSAGAVVDALAVDLGSMEADNRSRAWLALVRANLARRDVGTAAAAEAGMTAWAVKESSATPRIRAAIARAEVAAASRRPEEADAAYRNALALADASRIPLRLRQVVESYIGWMLDSDDAGRTDDRVLRMADRVADYADSDYDAALIQLRTYRRLGPPAAWRTALAHARALAGDRHIPSELVPPS